MVVPIGMDPTGDEEDQENTQIVVMKLNKSQFTGRAITWSVVLLTVGVVGVGGMMSLKSCLESRAKFDEKMAASKVPKPGARESRRVQANSNATTEMVRPEKLIILSTQKTLNSPSGKFLNLVYTEAFKRLGIVFQYKTYPAKRSSMLSDTGKVDGELSRIDSYNELHTDVIRVEEPHWTSGFIAIGVSPKIELNGWESLKKTNYRVDYRRGIIGCETNLPKVVEPKRINVVNRPEQGFNRILIGWSDIFIGAEMDLMPLLKSDKYRNTKLRVVGVMQEFTGHAFLHKKHKELAPKVSAVLKKMKKEGLLEQYRIESKLITYFE